MCTGQAKRINDAFYVVKFTINLKFVLINVIYCSTTAL